ncbi:hypothetical protein [Synechococcus sp. M16CYN]|uniref:hypothetical protein n=1 Tax=Synechococcus sp. M16CYN TaxID=3103139 RepID=UPI003340456E
MAQPHLIRLWVVVTLGSVLTISAGAFCWEKQLPNRLREAVERQNYGECVRASEQLAALQWLKQGVAAEQALCRQRYAKHLWAKGASAEALNLQKKLIASEQGDTVKNRAALDRWQLTLQERAVTFFWQGELTKALRLLSLQNLQRSQNIQNLRDTFQEIWNRNLSEKERLVRLVKQKRWWEALDSLNRLDHPWWQLEAVNERALINAALQSLENIQEHNQHAVAHPNLVSAQELELAVQRWLSRGMEPWEAFQAGCNSLKGQVEEDGPESFCRRSDTSPMTK